MGRIPDIADMAAVDSAPFVVQQPNHPTLRECVCVGNDESCLNGQLSSVINIDGQSNKNQSLIDR